MARAVVRASHTTLSSWISTDKRNSQMYRHFALFNHRIEGSNYVVTAIWITDLYPFSRDPEFRIKEGLNITESGQIYFFLHQQLDNYPLFTFSSNFYEYTNMLSGYYRVKYLQYSCPLACNLSLRHYGLKVLTGLQNSLVHLSLMYVHCLGCHLYFHDGIMFCSCQII